MSRRFLVIRRDNIGDLVCTTPTIHALRSAFPQDSVEVLCNSYNAPVLSSNPDVDVIHAYTKYKHRAPGTGFWQYWRHRIPQHLQLRKRRFDYVILAGSAFHPRMYKLAVSLKPRHIVGYLPVGEHPRHLDLGVTVPEKPLHEVLATYRLLTPLGISGTPGAPVLFPDPAIVSRLEQQLVHTESEHHIAIHISARKPSNRWPVERFAELMDALHRKYSASFLIFWSPGSSANPMHPGDDEKAEQLLSATAGLPVTPFPTESLPELIAGLSLATSMICSDGGAMHIAAGLGKPIVSFFGDSELVRWHPWGVPYVALQPESLNATEVTADQAMRAFTQVIDQNGG